MFDVGASELIVIAITALIVVGPDRLPRVARTAGLYLGRARRAVHQLRVEVERELHAEDLERARGLMTRGNLPLDEILDPAPPASARATSTPSGPSHTPPSPAAATLPMTRGASEGAGTPAQHPLPREGRRGDGSGSAEA